ncbi:MAG: DivIVA domain-containing protein [Coriobacteriia bacterium]|nr:DivIVA domain-containing protein [Coriobacteriia bacterium]MBS5478720.1 DivIVA domain-containing protein [Coriobacteriia bacterium]
MPITPADIQQKTFPEARRGYDPAKVDEFLEEISGDIDAMLRKIADLKTRLNNAEAKNAELVNQLDAAKAAAANAQSQAAAAAAAVPAQPIQTGKSSAYAATEEQLSAALIAAQQTAERIVNDAKNNAERVRSEAEGQARKVIRQALDEKQAELDEIERLKKSREQFRADYMALIQKFMDAAQTNFPSAMLSSAPSGSEATAATVIPRSMMAGGHAATPYGAQIDASSVDDLD